MTSRNSRGIKAAGWFASQTFNGRIEAPKPAPPKPQVDCMTIDRWNPETQRFDEVYVERCGICGIYHELPMCAFSTAKEDSDVAF